MTNIVPISDLKNYSEVLRNCDDGSTVYLTKNGRGKYVVQSLAEYEKLQAAVKLLAELSRGVESMWTVIKFAHVVNRLTTISHRHVCFG